MKYISFIITNILIIICFILGIFNDGFMYLNSGFTFNNVFAVLLFVLAVELVYFVVAHVTCGKSENRYLLLKLISSLLLVLNLGLCVYVFNIDYCDGFLTNVTKKSENGKYYMIFNNTKIVCTKDEYDEIIVGDDYTMVYKTNKLTGNNKLVKIYEAEDLFN